MTNAYDGYRRHTGFVDYKSTDAYEGYRNQTEFADYKWLVH